MMHKQLHLHKSDEEITAAAMCIEYYYTDSLGALGIEAHSPGTTQSCSAYSYRT